MRTLQFLLDKHDIATSLTFLAVVDAIIIWLFFAK
jgi:hypothetical protein